MTDSETSETSIPLCDVCISRMGGAVGDPDFEWRPMGGGDVCGAGDHDDAEANEKSAGGDE